MMPDFVTPPPASCGALRACAPAPGSPQCPRQTEPGPFFCNAGLHYTAKTCACPEPLNTRNWDKTTALPHPLPSFAPQRPSSRRSAALDDCSLAQGFLFLYGEAGAPGSSRSVSLCPCSCLTELPVRNPHTLLLPQPSLTGSCTTGIHCVRRFPSFVFIRIPVSCSSLPSGSRHVGDITIA